METKDTVKLLQECDAGTKMAVASIKDMLEYADDPKLKKALEKSKEHHEKLGNAIHTALNRCGVEDKDPTIMAQGMSWLKTNWKMSMDNSDATIADLITDGCNMGIKNLNKYKNQYKYANQKSVDFCGQLIDAEHQLCKDMRAYL